MTETPRSPDSPDNLDERPDVADATPPDNAAADTVGDPASSPQTPADVTPVDDAGQGQTDDVADAVDDGDDDPFSGADDDEQTRASAVVIPEYEQRITAAANAADNAEIGRITAEYNRARLDRVRQENDG